MKYQIQGKYFEDWTVGEEFETARRTVTETDIVLYTGLSGDFNPLHTNEEFAKKSAFGTRVAHGFLVHAISIGLMNQTNQFDGTLIAQKIHKNIVFTKGIVSDHTIHIRAKVIGKNDNGEPDRGEVMLEVDVIDEDGDVCSKSARTLVIKKAPEGSKYQSGDANGSV